MFVYEIAPIDFRWEFLHTVREIAAKLAAMDADRLSNLGDAGQPTCEYFLDSFERAKELAGSKGWEGDFRNDPVVFWLPAEERFEYGFVFKQDNNGTTYVVSPQELPHLAELG